MSSLPFFTNEAVSLEKKITLNEPAVQTRSEDIDSQYEISRCSEWIKSNNFQKVCLQFPNHLLPDSSTVCLKVQKLVNQTIYVLADSVYESCCIDYIAAAHVNADAIIHFGPVCSSVAVGSIPHLNIYEKSELDITKLATEIQSLIEDEIVMLVDTHHFHQYDEIKNAFMNNDRIHVYHICDKIECSENYIIIYVGQELNKLKNISFSTSASEMFYFKDKLVKYNVEIQILKKRHYLIEKIKDSRTIGIIIGTVSVKNYIDIVERMKKLVELSCKKYYLINVGKPTVAKLANFPELDVYVVVTCAQSEIYDTRDFYKPIVTPYDIEIALNANHKKDLKFSYDYNSFFNQTDILCSQPAESTDVSLLTNNLRSQRDESLHKSVVNDSQIALKPDGTVATSSDFGAGYLSTRSWKGLEQKLGQTEPELAEEGRRGIARMYKNELNM